MGRGGFRSGGSGFEQNRCPFVENKFTDYPSANRLLIGSGGRVGWAGFAGGYGRISQVFAVTTTNIENQPNNKNHQITATTKIIKSSQQKTKQKISKYKLDRIGEVEGGAAAKPARSGQNPVRSHQIQRCEIELWGSSVSEGEKDSNGTELREREGGEAEKWGLGCEVEGVRPWGWGREALRRGLRSEEVRHGGCAVRWDRERENESRGWELRNRVCIYVARQSNKEWLYAGSKTCSAYLYVTRLSLCLSSQDFWYWSWQELALHDLADMIHYINSITKSKIFVVGHSQVLHLFFYHTPPAF